MRRVAGYHDIRLDGILDLVIRAEGARVLDVGCNRGLVGFELANNRARLVHGCDIDADCIGFCRRLFIDLRNVETRFEVVDLTAGAAALDVFGKSAQYDIVLMLATYHKLRRIMPADVLAGLMGRLGQMTARWFGWRATSDKPSENEREMAEIDKALSGELERIHTSYISHSLGVAAIWARRC